MASLCPAGFTLFALNGTAIALIPADAVTVFHTTNPLWAGMLLFLVLGGGGVAQLSPWPVDVQQRLRWGLASLLGGAWLMISASFWNIPGLLWAAWLCRPSEVAGRFGPLSMAFDGFFGNSDHGVILLHGCVLRHDSSRVIYGVDHGFLGITGRFGSARGVPHPDRVAYAPQIPNHGDGILRADGIGSLVFS